MNKILNRIQSLCVDYDISIPELAKKVGKTKNTFYNYFNGKSVIDIETLQSIADVLNISLIDLFTDFPSDRTELPEDTVTLKTLIRSLDADLSNCREEININDNKISMLELELKALKREMKDKEKIISLQEKLIESLSK